MSSTNKTANLRLNQWIGTDKPARIDYVQDNQKIDAAFTSHTDDVNVHMSEEEKEKLSNPYTTYYGGNGEQNRVISFPFAPRVVIIFKKSSGFISYTSSKVIINAAMGIASNGSSGGISVSGSNATVYQSAAAVNGNEWYNLNENGGQYGVLAFR